MAQARARPPFLVCLAPAGHMFLLTSVSRCTAFCPGRNFTKATVQALEVALSAELLPEDQSVEVSQSAGLSQVYLLAEEFLVALVGLAARKDLREAWDCSEKAVYSEYQDLEGP